MFVFEKVKIYSNINTLECNFYTFLFNKMSRPDGFIMNLLF